LYHTKRNFQNFCIVPGLHFCVLREFQGEKKSEDFSFEYKVIGYYKKDGVLNAP